MSRTPTPQDVFYFSNNNQIQQCKPEEIAHFLPKDPEVYYTRGLFPKFFATIDGEGVVQKYVVFLHRRDTLWLVPQETDGSLSTQTIFTCSKQDNTVTFTEIKPAVTEDWVIFRCKEAVDDFSIGDLMEIRNAPDTYIDDRTITQTDTIDATREHTATTTSSTPVISAEELDSIHQKREAQRAAFFALKEKLAKAEAIAVTPLKLSTADTTHTATESGAALPISSPTVHKKSSSVIAKKPRNRKALFETVLAFTALSAAVKETSDTASDKSDAVTAASPLIYPSFSRRQLSRGLSLRDDSPFVCVLPEYIPNESATPVEPKPPTQKEIDDFTHYLTAQGVSCTEAVKVAMLENQFVRTLKDTIESYSLGFEFLRQIPERNLLELLRDRNIARLKCILLWMAEHHIEINQSRLMTLICSPALEMLTHALHLLKINHLFKELSISWTISAHNQKHNADDYDRTVCNTAWRLGVSDSFDSVNSDPAQPEYEENNSFEKFENIEPFGSSFFKSKGRTPDEHNPFEGVPRVNSELFGSPTVRRS